MPGDLDIRDHVLAGARGEIFVKEWPAPHGTSRLPLILLHDSLGSVELWRGFPAALVRACGRPVIAYDRLGFGRSAAHPGRLDPDFIAAEAAGDFAAVLAALEISEFHVFGHSVGGGMAVNIAAQFGPACRGLITESAQAFVEDRTLAGLRDAQALFADPQQVDRLRRYHGDKAPWVLSAWLDSWLAPSFADWSLDAALPKVRAPVLLIHGADDEYGSPRHPERIAASLSSPTQLAILPGFRHVPHREDEARVLALVSEFLADLP